jgi:hypothetical protein
VTGPEEAALIDKLVAAVTKIGPSFEERVLQDPHSGYFFMVHDREK